MASPRNLITMMFGPAGMTTAISVPAANRLHPMLKFELRRLNDSPETDAAHDDSSATHRAHLLGDLGIPAVRGA